MAAAIELAKKLVEVGFFDCTKTARTTLKHFVALMGKKVDYNNLTPGQALELMVKVGFTNYEQMFKFIEEPMLEEIEALKSENEALKSSAEIAKQSLNSAQAEAQAGRDSKAELEALRNGMLKLLNVDVVPSTDKEDSKETVAKVSAKEPVNEAKPQNIIIMLSDEERAWYDGVGKQLKEAKCGWSVLRTVYKRMHEVYSSNIDGACKAFLAEYPLDIYGPMFCKSLTAIAHYPDMRETFDLVFPGILAEYVQRKNERKN